MENENQTNNQTNTVETEKVNQGEPNVVFEKPQKQTIQIPEKYRPISAWGYFGYNLLFALPIAGFILLIVFSFDDSNINRKNYARSYFCALLIVVIILVVVFGIMGIGMSALYSSVTRGIY